MAQGRLESVASLDSSELHSAPTTGAVFYLNAASLPKGPYFQRRPFLNKLREFPRDTNGLVDMGAYHEFLVDPPAEAPIYLKRTAKAGWMYQHLYYQRSFYKQAGVPRIIRDEVLRKFCISPYNQIAMREDIEDDLHEQFEEHVSPPPPETMKMGVADFETLDRLGAAAVGQRVALLPEAIKYLAPEIRLETPLAYSQRPPVETSEMFDSIIDEALGELETPLVINQRVITGVIARMGRMINNEKLKREAERRIKADEIYYPMRLRTARFYITLSHELLETAINLEEQAVIELQTTTSSQQKAA